MTTFDRFEREIPRLMDELSPPHLPDYLDDMLRQTAGTPQRPAWSALERWLPMGVIARTQPMPSIPWRPIVALGLLVLLVAATLLVIGSQPRLPDPYGPARNGAIVFSTVEGDIVRADPETGAVTPVIAGAGTGFDSSPWFSNDGTKFAFDRRTAAGDAKTALVVANADGSGVRELVGPSSPIRWFDWSPSGDRMVVLREDDRFGLITIVDAVTGTPTSFQVGFDVKAASFRPGTDQLILSVPAGYYLVGADGTGLRQIVHDEASIDQFTTSPDGKLLAYATWIGGVAEGRIHVVDIETGAARQVDLDHGYTDLMPVFTPDGRALQVERHDAGGYKETILPLDGGAAVPMGVYHPSSTNGAGITLSPDGTQAIATYRYDGSTWLLDTATGEGERLDWPVPAQETPTWQRLAP